MEPSEGFPPIAAPDALILVLGSLPGRRSIAEQQYYAHPRNAFWHIMRDVFGVDGDYAERCEGLMRHRIAVWDVLASSVRPGSMDADIRVETAQVNDFHGFFSAHQQLRLVLLNGRKAGQLFEKCVIPALPAVLPARVMPSTSPAYASMRYDSKLETWRAALAACLDGE